LDKRLGGLQSRSGRGGEEKNSLPLPELEAPIIQPLAQRYTIQLSRLLETKLEMLYEVVNLSKTQSVFFIGVHPDDIVSV
jgi:hypothetical protein